MSTCLKLTPGAGSRGDPVVTKLSDLNIVLRFTVHSKLQWYQNERSHLPHISIAYKFVFDITYLRKLLLNEVLQCVTTFPDTGQVVTTRGVSNSWGKCSR